MGAMEVPVIDLGPLMVENGGGRSRAEIVRRVAEAAEGWSCFQVVNHPLAVQTSERTFQVSREFFRLPREEKALWKGRAAAAESGGAPPPVPVGYDDDFHCKGQREHKERLLFAWSRHRHHHHHDYNIWPSRPLSLCSVVQQHVDETERANQLVSGLICEGLGVDNKSIVDCFKDRLSIFAFFKYPAPPLDHQEDELVGFAPHTDYLLITMLLQDDVGGLQVERDGKWFNITPIKGAFVVLIGEVLQIWTNGKYKAVNHRVINKKGQSRHSISFGSVPTLEANIAPYSAFTKDVGKSPLYHAFKYGDLLTHRFNAKKNSNGETEVTIEMYATKT